MLSWGQEIEISGLRWSTGSGIRNWIEAICDLGNRWKKNNLTWIKKVGKIVHSSFDISKYAESSNKREGFCDMKERNISSKESFGFIA